MPVAPSLKVNTFAHDITCKTIIIISCIIKQRQTQTCHLKDCIESLNHIPITRELVVSESIVPIDTRYLTQVISARSRHFNTVTFVTMFQSKYDRIRSASAGGEFIAEVTIMTPTMPTRFNSFSGFHERFAATNDQEIQPSTSLSTMPPAAESKTNLVPPPAFRSRKKPISNGMKRGLKATMKALSPFPFDNKTKKSGLSLERVQTLPLERTRPSPAQTPISRSYGPRADPTTPKTAPSRSIAKTVSPTPVSSSAMLDLQRLTLPKDISKLFPPSHLNTVNRVRSLANTCLQPTFTPTPVLSTPWA